MWHWLPLELQEKIALLLPLKELLALMRSGLFSPCDLFWKNMVRRDFPREKLACPFSWNRRYLHLHKIRTGHYYLTVESPIYGQEKAVETHARILWNNSRLVGLLQRPFAVDPSRGKNIFRLIDGGRIKSYLPVVFLDEGLGLLDFLEFKNLWSEAKTNKTIFDRAVKGFFIRGEGVDESFLEAHDPYLFGSDPRHLVSPFYIKEADVVLTPH